MKSKDNINEDKTDKKSRVTIKSSASAFIVKKINKILLKIFLILFLSASLFFGGRAGIKKLNEIKTEKSHALIFRELERCAELVTAKTKYTDIISIKKTRIAGLAKSFSIIKYTGTLRAGIRDMRDAKISVEKGGKKASVLLPPMEILSNDISSIEVFDESKSIFVEISLKEIMEEIRFNQENASAQIIETGFMEESKKQAVRILETVLHAAGFSEVQVM